MLVLLTGPVRSGKSAQGLRLALASGRPVSIAVGSSEDDEEMRRRIARHRAERPDTVRVIETYSEPGWLDELPDDVCLLADCLGSLIAASLGGLVPEDAEVVDAATERIAEDLGDKLVRRLLNRGGPTVVVTNEVGWGIVPATPLGRLFRDVLGRANRVLTDGADAAYLVVDGRCVDMSVLPREVSWPKE